MAVGNLEVLEKCLVLGLEKTVGVGSQTGPSSNRWAGCEKQKDYETKYETSQVLQLRSHTRRPL